MKSIIIHSVILILILIFVSRIYISIHPFKIGFEKPYLGIGVFLLTVGILLISHQYYIDGKKDGINFSKDVIKEVMKEEEEK